jgi:hypothetical protein
MCAIKMTRATSKLRTAAKRDQRFQQKIRSWIADLGDGQGNVDISGKPGYVYIRMNGEVMECYNQRIVATHGTPIMVGYDPTEPRLFQTLNIRQGVASNYSQPIGAIGPHHESHEIFHPNGGNDVVWVQKRQYVPLRIGPYSGMSIQIYRDFVWSGTAWLAVAQQTMSMTTHIPSTTDLAALVLITVNTSGTVIATKGSEVNIADLGLDDLPAVPASTAEVLGAVRVYNGQTAVQEGRTNTDIIDLRWTHKPLILDGQYIRIGNIPGGNYFQASLTDGTVRLVGTATSWDDLRIAGSQVRAGVTAPALGTFGSSGNLRAYRFESGKHQEVEFEIQLPHSWKQGTRIYPHVHWSPINTTTGNVVWELEYAWSNIDGTFGSPSNMATDATAAGGTAWVHKLSLLKSGGNAYIDGTGKTFSSMIVCRLHRNAGSGSDTLAADVSLLEFDIHYEIDSFGADGEYTKA